MANIATPIRSYLQNALIGQATLVCEVAPPQQLWAGEPKLNQNATMTAPWLVGNTNLVPYLTMDPGDNLVYIQLFRGPSAFHWEQVGALTMLLTGPNSYSASIDLSAHIDPGLNSVTLHTTPAMFPSAGQFTVQFTWTYAGNTYYSDTTVIQLLQRVLNVP